MNNGTVEGFGSGVRFQDGASDNLVNNVRANNNNFGIRLAGASNNHITGNSGTDNFEGIAVELGSTNNRIDENVTNGSVASGIGVTGSSNTIADNSASGNFSGIWLTPSGNGNTVQINQVNSNTFCGMELAGSNNTIANNVASNNGAAASNPFGTGILVRGGATGNTIEGNTALGNFGNDLTELNPGSPPACANTWLNNTFNTKFPPGTPASTEQGAAKWGLDDRESEALWHGKRSSLN